MRLIALICTALITACAPSELNETAPEVPAPPAETIAALPTLEPAWIATGFTEPEGVAVYDNTLLISNISGDGVAKDGEGWISRVGMDGSVLEERWVKGLNAPKGMAVRGNILFVADIDAYHTINADTGELINTFEVPEAGFLNDVTVWQGGVYASDSASDTIFQLDENGYKAWLEDAGLDGPNGLLGLGDRLLIATMGGGGLLVSVDGARDVTTIATGLEDADGIAVLADGSYMVSSWPGQIWHVAADGMVTNMLDTEADGVLQNDLTGVGDLIVVPNLTTGTVTAWRVGG